MGNESYKIQGRIIDKKNQAPIEGLIVRAFDVDCLSEDDYLGEAQTEENGEFTIRYRQSEFVNNVLERFFEGGPDLVLKVYDGEPNQPEDRLLHTTERRGGASRFERYLIVLDVSEARLPSMMDIGRAANLPKSVLERLQNEGITEISNLFTLEGLKAIRKIDISNEQRRNVLGIARFTSASRNLSLSRKLAQTGISSFSQLARVPLVRVEESLESLDDGERKSLTGLYGKARIIAQMAASVGLEVTASSGRNGAWLANEIAATPAASIGSRVKGALEDLGLLGEIFAPDATCKDCDACEHVFSPLAYLFDLVDFINDTWGIPSNTLEKMLFQEIDSLDCHSGLESTMQIRLPIEVLEKYLNSRNLPRPGGDLTDAYSQTSERLLSLVGLSSDTLTPGGDTQAVHVAVTASAPNLSSLDTVVREIRRLKHQMIEESNLPPETLIDDATSEEIAEYERELASAEQELDTLKREFEQLIVTTISPALVTYRDLLIKASGETIASLENQLFIDLRSDPCHATTRITQLIQSLQSFVLAIRTGEIDTLKHTQHLHPTIGNVDFEVFDEPTWQWLRSYATWSAAMYVQVYPENVLMPPTLRGSVTPGFSTAIKNLRGGTSYARTEEALAEYDEHLEIIGSVEFDLRSAHLGNEAVYVFATTGKDLWLNTLDRTTQLWQGWLQFEEWDTETEPSEVRYIDPRKHERSKHQAKFIVKTDQDEYVVVTTSGKVEEKESEADSDVTEGNDDAEVGLLTSLFDEVREEFKVEIDTNSRLHVHVSQDISSDSFDRTRIDFNPGPDPLSLQACVVAARTLSDETDYDDVYFICREIHGLFSGRFRISGNKLERVGDWMVLSGESATMFHWMHAHFERTIPPILRHVYFEERFLHFPMMAAWALNRAGDFPAAHTWYRSLYDPFARRSERYGFPFNKYLQGAFERQEDWLNYAQDPHSIAAKRSGVYLRHVILMMVNNLLSWADHEFSLSNPESINRARELYLLAEKILQASALDNPCKDQKRALEFAIARKFGPSSKALGDMLDDLDDITRAESHNEAVAKIRQHLRGSSTISEFRERAKQELENTTPAAERLGFGDLLHTFDNYTTYFEDAFFAAGAGNWLQENNTGSYSFIGNLFGKKDTIRLPDVKQIWFCIPANPLLTAFESRIASNLAKIRSCRNIAGEPTPPVVLDESVGRHSVITDISALTSPSTAVVMTPPRYRYAYLVEKARQQSTLAQQLGAALLAAIEKRDKERFDRLVARHNQRVAEASVRLKSLSVTEAKHAMKVALDQKRRAEVQHDFWTDRLESGDPMFGMSELEMAALVATGVIGFTQALNVQNIAIGAATAGGLLALAGGLGGGALATAAGIPLLGPLAPILAPVGTFGGALAGLNVGALAIPALATAAAVLPQLASFERRVEEWGLQLDLTAIDVDIADGQIDLAENRVGIAEQDKSIAELQRTHASAVLEYLANKVSNEELYEWMIDILKDNYHIVMQISTSTALLAQSALEFQRQEKVSLIQGDYWTISDDELTKEQKDLGLLGAERLLTDLTRLDNHKLTTEKRRLQLSKTVSLASLLPTEFIRFRREGNITFKAFMVWFDWDFPGHFLRLIKNVRVAVLALVPPRDGIHAMLRNDGSSTVVVNENGIFVPKPAIRTFGETVALDSPFNDSGVFVMDYNDPMLLPFEGLGVDTTWTFELPRATNRFHFDTIVDVLFTFEYTAMHDDAYRDQVIQRLGNTMSADIVISLKNNYPDQWYHLNNPIDPTANQEVSLEVTRHAFPPNLRTENPDSSGDTLLQMRHLTVIISDKTEGPLSDSIPSDGFEVRRGNVDVPVDVNDQGFFSTRLSGNNPFTSGNTVDPIGEWTLKVDSGLYAEANELRPISQVEDVLLVLTVVGEIDW